MSQATLGKNGQVTLPADVRRALGVDPGDTLRFVVEANGDVRLFAGPGIARTLRPSKNADRPVPHGARAPVDFAPEDSGAERARAARGVDALRGGDAPSRKDG